MAKKNIRKKPKQRRSQDVLNSIYQAAYVLLDSPNQKVFTTNQIAKKAGVSIGSLYQYFPNKETILDQILQQVVIMMTKDFIELIQTIPTHDYKSFVQAFVKGSFEMCLKHPRLMKRTFHIEKSEQTIELIFSSREKICQVLSDIIKTKFKIKDQIDLKVYMMVHAYMGIVEAYVSSESQHKIEQIESMYAEIIFKMAEL